MPLTGSTVKKIAFLIRIVMPELNRIAAAAFGPKRAEGCWYAPCPSHIIRVMPLQRRQPDASRFNLIPTLPFNLRVQDFQMAMQDVYDFFYDVNTLLLGRGLERFDDMLRPAIMSGLLSDMLTASLAKHSRSLVQNEYFNGHPDLLVKGVYPRNAVKAGTEGVEIKTTRKRGGAVDTHGARDQWMCVFVYEVDNTTEPAVDRAPMAFAEIYLAHVTRADFRRNERGELGTRTATLSAAGIRKFRRGWVYHLRDETPPAVE